MHEVQSMSSSQYATALNNPNIKFVIEDLGEEVEEADEEDEEEYYEEYDEEGEEGEQETSFNVEVELGNGTKQMIKLTEEEYTKIFDEGEQQLLIQKIKEAQKSLGLETHSNLTASNTHFSNKNASSLMDSRRS
jgi:hypothetical protein